MAVPSVEAVRLEVVGGKTLAYAVVVDEVGSLYDGLLMAWRDLEESVVEVDVVDCLNSVVSSRCRRLGVLKGLITRQSRSGTYLALGSDLVRASASWRSVSM